MKTIGIFEAKTKLPGLCRDIAKSGTPVLVQRRGKPLVMISPAPADSGQQREDIYGAWKRWTSIHGKKEKSEFPEIWKMRNDRKNPSLD